MYKSIFDKIIRKAICLVLVSCFCILSTNCVSASDNEDATRQMLHLKASSNAGWAVDDDAIGVSADLTAEKTYSIYFKYYTVNTLFDAGDARNLRVTVWDKDKTTMASYPHAYMYSTHQYNDVKHLFSSAGDEMYNDMTFEFTAVTSKKHYIYFDLLDSNAEIYIADFVLTDSEGNQIVSGLTTENVIKHGTPTVEYLEYDETKFVAQMLKVNGSYNSSNTSHVAAKLSLETGKKYSVYFKYKLKNYSMDCAGNRGVAFQVYNGSGVDFTTHHDWNYLFPTITDGYEGWNDKYFEFTAKNSVAFFRFNFMNTEELYIADFEVKNAKGDVLIAGFDALSSGKWKGGTIAIGKPEAYDPDLFKSEILHVKANTADYSNIKGIGTNAVLVAGNTYTVNFKYHIVGADSDNFGHPIRFCDYDNSSGSGWAYRYNSTHVDPDPNSKYAFATRVDNYDGLWNEITLTFNANTYNSTSHLLGFEFVGSLADIYITDFSVKDESGRLILAGVECLNNKTTEKSYTVNGSVKNTYPLDTVELLEYRHFTRLGHDLNHDAVLDSADLIYLKKALLGIEGKIKDLNQNGHKGIDDLIRMKKTIANQDAWDNLPISETDEYYHYGTALVIKKDCTLDFTNIVATEQKGKLFVGWTDVEGNAIVNNSMLSSGTKVVAQYVAYTAESFYVDEAEITNGNTLKFTATKSSELSIPNILEYGVLMLESDVLNNQYDANGKNYWAPLVETTYVYNGESFTPKKSVATSVDDINVEIFTDAITNTEDYTCQYTVRGYIKYSDYNGIEKILYTDSVFADLFVAAEAMLNSGNLTSEQETACKDIIKAVEEINEEAYADFEVIPFNTVTSASDKMMLRTVEIDSGKGGDPIEIVQLSDLHYNYVNDLDRLENNQTIMGSGGSLEGRLWGAYGAFARDRTWVRSAINYARTADQVVFTGDVIDYLTRGALELTVKEIWSKIPSAIIALGNHDMKQACQSIIADSLPLEERYSMLQDTWKHNIFYSSKVVGDKAMVVQMHNGESRFLKEQIEPLKADIEAARNNGYKILLFVHQTLATNNPNETAVNAIHVNDTGWAYNEDFANNSAGHHIDGTEDEYTKQVYDLITNNADVISGIFNGHIHSAFYTEIIAKTADGKDAIIPQYTMTGTVYDAGHITKIIVK